MKRPCSGCSALPSSARLICGSTICARASASTLNCGPKCCDWARGWRALAWSFGARTASCFPRQPPLTSFRSFYPLAWRSVVVRRSGPCGKLRTPGFTQRLQKRLSPPVHVLLTDIFEQLLVSCLPLFERHLQRPLNGVCGAIGVVGIDQQGFLQLLRGPGKARQHQHPWIGRILRSNEFLGDQVHAVAQGCDQCHAHRTVEPRQAFARHVAVDKADRHPVKLTKVAVDGAA